MLLIDSSRSGYSLGKTDMPLQPKIPTAWESDGFFSIQNSIVGVYEKTNLTCASALLYKKQRIQGSFKGVKEGTLSKDYCSIVEVEASINSKWSIGGSNSTPSSFKITKQKAKR